MPRRIIEHYLNVTYDSTLTVVSGTKILGIATEDYVGIGYGSSKHKLLILTPENENNGLITSFNMIIRPYFSYAEVETGYQYLQTMQTKYCVDKTSGQSDPIPVNHHFFYKITPEPGPAIEVDVPFNRLSHIE